MRVKIHVPADERYNSCKEIEFFINDFPAIPRADDLISIADIVDEKDFTDEQFSMLMALSYSVWYVSWERDKEGIYPEIVLSGE